MRAGPIGSVRVLVVGLFEAATREYAAFIRENLLGSDKVAHALLDDLPDVAAATSCDLVLTLANRRAEVEARMPRDVPVVGLNFIPSLQTRINLARVDPASRVGIVSTFPEFMGLMRPNLMLVVPQVASVDIIDRHDAGLAEFLKTVDVVIYATGSDEVADMLSPRQISFEYRYTPDPNMVRSRILPLINQLGDDGLRPKSPASGRSGPDRAGLQHPEPGPEDADRGHSLPRLQGTGASADRQ